MQFIKINRLLSAPYATLDPDRYGFTVNPISQVGSLSYEVELITGQIIEIPLYFQGEYYKQEELNSEYPTYFPENLLRFADKDPETAVMKATTDLVDGSYYSGRYVPLTEELNLTYPEYCSNQLLGIAISLVTEQFKLGNIDKDDWVEVKGTSGTVFNPSPDNYILNGEVVGMLTPYGKFSQVKYLGTTYTLKYGATANGDFCGKGRAIYIRSTKEIHPNRDYFTFDTGDGLQFDEGVWYSSQTTEAVKSLFETQGIPIVAEVLFDQTPMVVDESELNLHYLPTYGDWQLGAYTPDLWLAELQKETPTGVLIKFDGEVYTFAIESQGYFTFDSPVLCWDKAIWG
jgi:hypothetical protein